MGGVNDHHPDGRMSRERQTQIANPPFVHREVADDEVHLPQGIAEEQDVVARASFAATLDPIVTIDATGRILCASDSIRRLLGWRADELLGRNVSILMPGPHRSAHQGYIDRYIQTGGSKLLGRPRRFDALHKDGSLVPIELSVSRTSKPGDGPLFVGILRDMTEQIVEERSQIEERERYQQQLAEQTAALQEALLHMRMADRMASIGTLAAGLGHDMNNVLLPVRAHLSVMEFSGVCTDFAAHMKSIRAAIDYLQQLADGLHFLVLDTEPGAVTSPDADTVDLHHWWTSVGVLLAKALPRHVAFRVELPENLPPVGVSAHALTQAVLNLIANAGDACAESLAPEQPAEVCFTAETIQTAGKSSVRIAVSDTGKGMSEYVRRRAFDLFFTTKTRGFGTGLGLALVRRVVERVGGTVAMESAEGVGTTVSLQLPIASGSDVAPGSQAAMTALMLLPAGRLASLIREMLDAEGVSDADPEAFDASICIADSRSEHLEWVRQWRRHAPNRPLVLFLDRVSDTPPEWTALNPVTLELSDDLATIQSAISKALSMGSQCHQTETAS